MIKLTVKQAMLLYVLLVCSLSTSTLVNCCLNTPYDIGNMTRDLVVKNGSTINLICSLKNTTINYENNIIDVNSSMILFTFNGKHYPSSRIINNTFAEFTIHNATVDDTGIYTCNLNISYDPLFICISHVTVGYEPLPVKNFKCISIHYRNLTCSWTPPNNPVKTTYTLEDYQYGFLIPCGQSYENSCEWRRDSEPPYRNGVREYTFYLTGENSLGTNKQVYLINHYSIIQPDIPQNFKLYSINSTNATLVWNASKDIEFEYDIVQHLRYEIKIRRHNSDDDIRIISNISENKITVNNLIPNTKYNISIRVKTNESQSQEYWSNYASILIETEQDVPFMSPVVTSGTFMTIKKEASRSIVLYWKPIDPIYHNAPNLHYIINVFKQNSNPAHCIKTVSTVQNATFILVDNMDLNTAYLFKISASNVVGNSTNYTEIFVPEEDKRLSKKPSYFKYEQLIHSHTYTLTWEMPETTTNTFYTLFWCPASNTPPYCIFGEPIDWTYTHGTNINISLSDKRTYNFAISVNELDTNHISGMFWENDFKDIPNEFIYGTIIGIISGLTLFIIICYIILKKLKKNIDAIRAIKIRLPDGLEAPQAIVDNISVNDSGVSHESFQSDVDNLENENFIKKNNDQYNGHTNSSSSSQSSNDGQFSFDSGADIETPNKINPPTHFNRIINNNHYESESGYDSDLVKTWKCEDDEETIYNERTDDEYTKEKQYINDKKYKYDCLIDMPEEKVEESHTTKTTKEEQLNSETFKKSSHEQLWEKELKEFIEKFATYEKQEKDLYDKPIRLHQIISSTSTHALSSSKDSGLDLNSLGYEKIKKVPSDPNIYVAFSTILDYQLKSPLQNNLINTQISQNEKNKVSNGYVLFETLKLNQVGVVEEKSNC